MSSKPSLFRNRRPLPGAVAAGLFVLLATVPPIRAAQIDIVAIGASTTAGKGVGLEGAYPAQLETMLRAKGYDISIRNEGIAGDTSSGMLSRIDALPSETRLVLLQIAHTNDGRRGITAAQTEANRQAIVERLQARKIKVIFVNRRVPSDEIQMDGLHPDATGQHAIATRLLPQVMSAIGSRR